jgi:hypothetical protein
MSREFRFTRRVDEKGGYNAYDASRGPWTPLGIVRRICKHRWIGVQGISLVCRKQRSRIDAARCLADLADRNYIGGEALAAVPREE